MTKPLLALLVAGLGFAGTVRAQVVTINIGTSSSALSPLNQNVAHQAQEFIYLQSQINTAGRITRLAFEKASGSDVTPLTNTVIYLKHTTATVFTTGLLDTTGYQRVWAGSFPNAGTSGYQEVTLTTPFAYNNTANLAVLVIRNNGSVAGTGVRALWRYEFINRNSCRRYSGATALSSATSLAVTDVLVNMRLTFPTATGTTQRYVGGPGLYPNPATDRLYVPAQEPAALRVTDLRGRTLRSAVRLRPVGGRLELPLADLPAGSYLLHQTAADGRTTTQRFMRE
jgi:hypothetical protein